MAARRRALLRAPRAERLPRSRRSPAPGAGGILQPLRQPQQSGGVVARGRAERGGGGADHRGRPRRDGMDPGTLRVAIVGAGPAGCALGILLAGQGADVTLFDDGRHPELLVGESLVPAVVPILRRLRMEEELATFSCVKPGVSFIWSQGFRVSVTFKRFAPGVFPYAYNIPRPRFDKAILARAVAAGVRHVPVRAKLQPHDAPPTGAELTLAPETLARATALGGRAPHLIVDATGRA